MNAILRPDWIVVFGSSLFARAAFKKADCAASIESVIQLLSRRLAKTITASSLALYSIE